MTDVIEGEDGMARCFWGEGEIPTMAEEYNAYPEVTAIAIESATAGISIADEPILGGGDTPGCVNIIAGAGAVAIALTPGSVNITAPEMTITTASFNVITPTGAFSVE